MTTSTVAPEIHAFAQGVRAALADLPAEEVDDLTEGLEADLAESLAEDLRRTLPDPIAYAAELRLAAGLPAASASKSGMFGGLVSGWRDTRDAVAIAARRQPALAAVLDFLWSLRPVWWVLRAWLATWLLAAFFGMERRFWFDGAWWIVLAAFVVISAQWGQRRWVFPGLRGVVLVGNLAAALLLLPVVTAAQSWGGSTVYLETEVSPDLTGVYLNGQPVTNIFGYDATGRPLTGVQLFDQDGKPLATSVAGGNGCLNADCQKTGLWAPSTLRNGTVAWNVFPMKMVEAEDLGDGRGPIAAAGAEPQEKEAPFKRVPALVAAEKVAKSD